eukprot:COSAG02_NODE_7341_length_3056_cov_4.843422_2_plen_371_part_00
MGWCSWSERLRGAGRLAGGALKMGKKKIRTRKIVRDPRFTTTNIKGRRAVSVASLQTAAERQEKKDSYGEALQRKKERKQARVEAWQGVKKPSAAPAMAATGADGAAVHPMSAEAQLAAAKKKKKKGPNRGGKERRARHRDKITNKKEEWTPTPRGDLAHWLRMARKGGVPVKSKNEMPAVQELGTMMKRFRKRLQPRGSDYNGQGIARPSVYIQLRTAEFLGQFKDVFDEHVGEWGGRHLKTFRSEKDMQMEWRQRLKQKQATDESVFRSKRDIKEMRREQRQVEQKQQELAAMARGGSGNVGPILKRKRALETNTQPGGARLQHTKKQKAARDPGAEAERAQALAAYKQLKQKQALHKRKQKRVGGPR